MQTGVIERCKKFQSRSIKGSSKKKALELVLNMIDLTTLEGADTPDKVRRMCYKAQHLRAIPNLPSTAAVCVYPTLVKTAKEALKGTQVKVAAVATGFPAGQVPKAAKILDTQFALDEGADEIDMVISRGKFLSGEYNYVHDRNSRNQSPLWQHDIKSHSRNWRNWRI